MRRVLFEQDSERNPGDASFERVAIVASALRHPLVRVVDRLQFDPRTGRDDVVASSATVADHVMVRFQPGRTRAEIDARLQHAGLRVRRLIDEGGIALVEFPLSGGDPLPVVLQHLREAPDLVAVAEPDGIVTTMDGAPSDPAYVDGTLWGLHNTGQNAGAADQDIDAPEGWATATDASAVVVAVIDTGVRYTHEDLAANMWRNPGESGAGRETNGIDDDANGYVDDVFGINAAEGTGNPNDDFGHGTHVAGTIAGVGDNGLGVTGVAWRARIMAVKFLNSAGIGTTSDAIAAVNYARVMGADIINSSWGGSEASQLLRDAFAAAAAADAALVCAAGNYATDSARVPLYPACFDLPELVSVAAIDRTGGLAFFSSFGIAHVAAPGRDIISTFHRADSDYAVLSGTSMAAPHAAGVLALARARYPSDTAAAAVHRVLSGAVESPLLARPMLNHRVLNLQRPLNDPTLTLLPVVRVSPSSIAVAEGERVELTADVDSDSPAVVQWLRNREPIAGAIASTLTIDSARREDGGVYALRVTNAAGATFSRPVTVSVVGPPLLVTQPDDVSAVEGTPVSFTVAAIGSGTERLSYQWTCDGAALAGATHAVLLLPQVATAHAGEYRVTVSSIHGSSDSRAATLTVVPAQAPAITAQPAPAAVTADQDAVFTVAVTGTPVMAYQWFKDGSPLAGEVEPTLRIRRAQMSDAGGYHVVVTNSGGVATSDAASLSVAFAPVAPFIVRHPIARDVHLGDAFTLTVVAKGTPAPTCQWSLDGAVIPGATGATHVVERATKAHAGSYAVVATNASGSATSDSVPVTVRDTLATSGWSWRHPVPQGNTLHAVTFTEGRFIAVGVGGVIVTSPDGVTWTPRSSGVTGNLMGVAADHSRVVAAGTGVITLSEDGGISWTKVQLSGTPALGRVVFGNGLFVALSDSKAILVSRDGRTWTEKPLPPSPAFYSGLAFGLGRFWVGANDLTPDSPELYASTDGDRWDGMLHGFIDVSDVAFGNGVLLAVAGERGAEDGSFQAGNSIISSTDGMNWFVRNRALLSSGLRRGLVANRFSHVNGHFAGLGSGLGAMLSPDGISWREVPLPTTERMTCIAYGAGTYVVTGLNGQILTSYDTARWTARLPSGTQVWRSVAHGPGGFVAAGGAIALRSKGGVLWTQAVTGRNSVVEKAAFAHGHYLLIGERQLSWSSDAVTWTHATLPVTGLSDTFHAAATDGLRTVAVGQYLVAGSTVGRGVVMTSTDRSVWAGAPGADLAALRDVIHDGTRFIAVGRQGVVLSSLDGLAWTTEARVGDEELRRVATDGRRYVAISSNHFAIHVSDDLTAWSAAVLPETSGFGFTDLVHAQGQFFALRTDGAIFASVDGSTWDAAGTQPGNLALCYGDRTLVTAGMNNIVMQSDPMVTRAHLLVPAPARQIVRRGASARIALDTLGAGPLTYQWRKDGVDLPGATTAVLDITGVEPQDAGEYAALVRDGTDESISQSAYVAVVDIGASLPGGAGAASITITAPEGFPWTIDIPESWIRTSGATRGSGSTTRTLAVAANYSGGPRTAHVLVGGAAFTLIQAPSESPPPPSDSRLVNISTRGMVIPGADPMIAGFYISGVSPKRVLVRAAGPALRRFGISDYFESPKLSLYDADGTLRATNQIWSMSSTPASELYRWTATVGAFPFELHYGGAAILATLPPGRYTAHVTGDAVHPPGIALVEVYEAMDETETLGGRRLVNLSTRCHLGTGEAVLIAGFVIGEGEPRRLLIRGVGPTLGRYGVSDVVADPRIDLHASTHTIVGANDNWDADPANGFAVAQATAAAGAFSLPAGSRDAALVVSLLPGAYTVHATGVNGSSGTALIEVYEVRP